MTTRVQLTQDVTLNLSDPESSENHGRQMIFLEKDFCVQTLLSEKKLSLCVYITDFCKTTNARKYSKTP